MAVGCRGKKRALQARAAVFLPLVLLLTLQLHPVSCSDNGTTPLLDPALQAQGHSLIAAVGAQRNAGTVAVPGVAAGGRRLLSSSTQITWAQLQLSSGSPPSARYDFGMAAWGGVLYVFGGYKRNDLHGYTVASGAWSDLSSPSSGSPPSTRFDLGMEAWGGVLYVFGGFDNWGRVNDLHSCTPECNEGWDLEGLACSNADECAESTDNCDNSNAVCVDTDGSFTCTCNSGWTSSDAGVTCSDVIECGVSDNCNANAACSDSEGSFTCTCNSGWRSSDAGVTCIPEAMVEFSASLQMSLGEFDSAMQASYKAAVASVANITADKISIRTPTMPAEQSADGRRLLVFAITVPTSILVGADRAEPVEGVLVTDLGEALAAEGIILSSMLIHTDECFDGSHSCDKSATCFDTDGSFTCACNAGYTGEGKSCTDKDECTLGTDNCDSNAQCANTEGSFTCACNSGWLNTSSLRRSEPGVTCSNVVECGATDNCDANAVCVDSQGSFTCTCNSGWASSNAGVTCIASTSQGGSAGMGPAVLGAVGAGGLALLVAAAASWIWLRRRSKSQPRVGHSNRVTHSAESLQPCAAPAELPGEVPLVADEAGGWMPRGDLEEEDRWLALEEARAEEAGWKREVAEPEEDKFAPSAPPLQDPSAPAAGQHSMVVPSIDYGEVTVLHHLTSGSFKAVCRAQWCPAGGEPRIVALLVLRVGSVGAEKATFEKLGRHPYLTQLFAMTKNEQGQECLLAEYAEHGSLDVFLQEKQDGGVVVTSEVLVTAATQICDGMAQLAVYNVIHRDLAARNVLVFQMHPSDHRLVSVKTTDYGLAVHGSSVSTISTRDEEAGPLRWMAPEAITRRRYTQQSDVFAFGVTLWEMWSMGGIPWDVYTDAEAGQLVKQGQRPAKPEGCPEEVYAVMKLCWADNPARRPPFLQLRTHLQDALKRVSVEEHGPTCVICLERDPSVALFPCCHRCLCDSPECKAAIQGLCPICRSAVEDMRQIYDP